MNRSTPTSTRAELRRIAEEALNHLTPALEAQQAISPPDQGTNELEKQVLIYVSALASSGNNFEPSPVSDELKKEYVKRFVHLVKTHSQAHIRRVTLEAQHTAIKNFEPLQRTHDTCLDAHSCIGYQNAASDFDNEKEILLAAISKELQEIEGEQHE